MACRVLLAAVLIAAASAAYGQPAPGSAPVLRRWVEVQNASMSLRYRFVDNTEGEITTNQTQHREAFRVRVKFDPAGRYAATIGANSGPVFRASWGNTGWGDLPAQLDFDVRTLFVSARPVAAVEAQAGGLLIIKGQSTEVTTYDEDGYITGARLSLRAPARLFFNEISVTRAFLTPDPALIPVGERLRHMDEPNYTQVLVDRRLGARAAFSLDYTDDRGAHTWRQAVNVKTPELRVADSVIVEAYERTNRSADGGFAVTAEKTVNRYIAYNGGYAQVDPAYGGLNADRFHSGKRVFGMITYTISPDFLASVFLTRAVGSDVPLPQRTLSNIIFTYNALPSLRRTGLF